MQNQSIIKIYIKENNEFYYPIVFYIDMVNITQFIDKDVKY